MAKLKGPLFSLGASQQLGKSLVYFTWKGLNVVREYVIPANPKTQPQKDQRARLTAAVAEIHTAMAHPTRPLDEGDTMAYALWAGVVQAATTWFNQAVREWIDRLVDGKKAIICRFGNFSSITATGFVFALNSDQFTAGKAITGQFKWGTSKTALINTEPAVPNLPSYEMKATWIGLTTKTKYFIQFEALTTAPAYAGAKSGIYYVTTS